MADTTTEITPEFGEVREEERFKEDLLHSYLRSKVPGADAPMEVMQFRGGHSNLTYLLRFGDREWVVRRPPFGPLPKGGHDMAREYRVLSRLWQAFKPAPRAILFCDDPSILGAPFFVMERQRNPDPHATAAPARTRRRSRYVPPNLGGLHQYSRRPARGGLQGRWT